MDPNSPQPQQPQQPLQPEQPPQPSPQVVAPQQPAPAPTVSQPVSSSSSQPVQSGTNGLSIVGLVLAFFIPLVGLIVSIAALSKAKKNHQSTGIAVAGIVVSSLFMLLAVPIFIAFSRASVSGVKGKAYDTERQVDIDYLHSQVQTYYGQTGKYPTLDNMNDSSWRSTNLPSFDAEALKDPKGTSDKLVSTPSSNAYSYDVVDAGGDSCDNVSKDCLLYTLAARKEDGSAYTRSSSR